jgi:hypothetical protein
MRELEILIHIADLNAAEIKYKRQQRSSMVTAATIEQVEWEAFKAKVKQRARLLRAKQPTAKEDDVTFGADVDEDDLDSILAIIGILERAKRPFTLTEVVSALQKQKVLSREFVAAARDQARRLLKKLRAMNKAYQDTQGRWSLL